MQEQTALFRDAMANFPSGVTIVSTTDDAGCPRGFTASAFSSVSMDPPLVLVCVAKSAESYPAFAQTQRFAINILKREHLDLAMRFAKKGMDKFAGGGFEMNNDDDAPPYLSDALVSLICDTYSVCDAGDHSILIGEVQRTHISPAKPLVYFNRDFWDLEKDQALKV